MGRIFADVACQLAEHPHLVPDPVEGRLVGQALPEGVEIDEPLQMEHFQKLGE